jgi:hypothetical protein
MVMFVFFLLFVGGAGGYVKKTLEKSRWDLRRQGQNDKLPKVLDGTL